MFDFSSFQNREGRLNEVFRARLGVRGKTLAKRLRYARRYLPRKARQAGQGIEEAQQLAQHPKLARMIDNDALDANFDTLETHLKTVDRSNLRAHAILGIAAGLVFNLLLLGALALMFLRWQGLL